MVLIKDCHFLKIRSFSIVWDQGIGKFNIYQICQKHLQQYGYYYCLFISNRGWILEIGYIIQDPLLENCHCYYSLYFGFLQSVSVIVFSLLCLTVSYIVVLYDKLI